MSENGDGYWDEVQRAVGKGTPSILLGTSTRSLVKQLRKLREETEARAAQIRRQDMKAEPGRVRVDLRALHERLGNVHRLDLPGTPEDWAGAVMHAEAGCVTELIRPDGRVAARIVPS